jgi:hypothetical protein
MPPEAGDIALKTGADALIDLLRQRGELALAEAAKALSQPETVVESWATFLEEEGIIRTRYKFTTPYYALAEMPIRPGTAKPEPVKLGPPPPPVGSAKSILPADALAEAEAALSSGDLDKARELYLQVKQAYEVLPVELEQRARQLLDGLTSVGTHYFQVNHARIAALVKSSNDALKEGKLQPARQNYEQAKRLFDILPVHPAKERSAIEAELLDLAERLANREYAVLLRIATTQAKTVEDLLTQAATAIQRGDAARTRDIYQRLIAEKEKIPAGFLPKKAEFDAKALHINEQLTDLTVRQAGQEFEAKAAKLQQLFIQIEGLIRQAKLDDAVAPFEESRKVFGSLPDGFLERRSGLHAKLIALSKALIGARFAKRQAEFFAKRQVIEGFFTEAENGLKQANISRAQLAYEKLIPLVNSLPSDFAEETLQFRLRLIALYRRLTT